MLGHKGLSIQEALQGFLANNQPLTYSITRLHY